MRRGTRTSRSTPRGGSDGVGGQSRRSSQRGKDIEELISLLRSGVFQMIELVAPYVERSWPAIKSWVQLASGVAAWAGVLAARSMLRGFLSVITFGSTGYIMLVCCGVVMLAILSGWLLFGFIVVSQHFPRFQPSPASVHIPLITTPIRPCRHVCSDSGLLAESGTPPSSSVPMLSSLASCAAPCGSASSPS